MGKPQFLRLFLILLTFPYVKFNDFMVFQVSGHPDEKTEKRSHESTMESGVCIANQCQKFNVESIVLSVKTDARSSRLKYSCVIIV